MVPPICEYDIVRYLSSVRPYDRYQAYKGAYTKGEAFALGAHLTDLGWNHQDVFRFLLVSAMLQRRRNEHDGGNAGTMEAVGEARDEEESSGQGGARECGGGRRQGGSYNPERDSPLGVVRP